MQNLPLEEKSHVLDKSLSLSNCLSVVGQLPHISIVIPVYNEAGSIKSLLDDIHNELSGKIEYEIIIVDDGSSDGTDSTLARLFLEHGKQLRIVKHARNYGQSTALLSGIRSARADWIVTMDGDGQNNPRDIMKMIETRDASVNKDIRAVFGIRKKRKDNLVKKGSSLVANYIRNIVLRDMVSDTGCGLKLIHRSTYLDLPYFDHMHRFLPALIKRSGCTVSTLEVSHRPRIAGKSKYTINNRLWTGIIDLLGVLWLMRRGKVPIMEEVNYHDK